LKENTEKAKENVKINTIPGNPALIFWINRNEKIVGIPRIREQEIPGINR
jgi:hypothetical protein